MDPARLRALLEAVEAGGTSVDDAVKELRELPFRAFDFAHVDTHRHLRTGFPEVVLGEGKTPEQIAAVARDEDVDVTGGLTQPVECSLIGAHLIGTARVEEWDQDVGEHVAGE